MSLTANKIAVGMFGAAAGGFKSAIESSLTSVGTVATVQTLLNTNASGLGTTEATTNAAFAQALVDRLLPTVTTAQRDSAKTAVEAFMTANPGLSRAEVVVQAITYIDQLPSTDPLAAAATSFASRVSTADKSTSTSTTLADLQAVTFVPFDLTTSTTDNLTGSPNADSFSGSVSNAAGTLQVTDKVSGGAGDDTLSVALSIDFAGFTTGSVSGVETIALSNTGGTSRGFDASGITGATTYTLDGTNAGFTLTDLATGLKTISLSGQTTGALTTTFVNGAAETGASATSDALTLNLNGVGGTTAGSAIDLTLNSFEVLNIVSTGTNNIDDLGATRKMNISGAGDITVRTVSTALTEFDGSAATGKITATLTSAGASALKSVKGGSKDDTLTVEAGDLPSTATLAGGDGTDTLSYSTAALTTAQYSMSGIENLSLTATSGTLTFIGSKVTDLAKVTTVAAVAGAVTLTDSGSGAREFVASGATADVAISSDHSGSTTVNYSALAATTTARTVTAGIDPLADYTFAESTGTLTVNVNDLVDVAGSTITAAKVSSVELNVASGKNDVGTELTEFNSTITAAAATSLKVNASGILGAAAKITAGKATSAEVINGSNAGRIQLDTAALTSVKITTGSDLSGLDAAALTKLQTIDITATKGIVTFANTLAAARSITLAGTGTTSEARFGALGQASNGYDLSVTASGLAGGGTTASPAEGLTLGAMVVGTGYNVTLDVSKMTGGLTATSITSTGDTDLPKDITVNAAGMGGTLAFTGGIKGSGAVTVNAKGAYDVALTTIEGGTVVVDVSGTTEATGVVVGNITAKSSATVTYQTGAANTQTILATADSTDLAVTVTGGALKDTITVTGGAVQKTMTVSGNLGATTDEITVTNTASGATATGINVSALTNYDVAILTTGAGAQTIVGGSGKDTIRGGQNASTTGDTLTGGAGNDSFRFEAGDSPYTAPDRITDFSSGDEIWLGFADTIPNATANRTAVTGTTSAAAMDVYGVVTFATLSTQPASLAAAATLVEAAQDHAAGRYNFFAFGGKNYIFVDNGVNDLDVNDLVIELTGISFPSATLTNNNGGTGLSGFGA